MLKVNISEGTTTRSFTVNLISSDVVKCSNTFNLTVSTSESWCGAATNANNVSQVIAANNNGTTKISYFNRLFINISLVYCSWSNDPITCWTITNCSDRISWFIGCQFFTKCHSLRRYHNRNYHHR